MVRYVERNPLRANLVERAEQWEWSSLPLWLEPPLLVWLDPGPVARPPRWLEYVGAPQTEVELAALKRSVERGTRYGRADWVERTAAQLKVESSLNSPGRPRKGVASEDNRENFFGPK